MDNNIKDKLNNLAHSILGEWKEKEVQREKEQPLDRRAVAQYDAKTGKLVKVFNNRAEAANKTGSSVHSITASIQRKEPIKGFLWVKVKDVLEGQDQ